MRKPKVPPQHVTCSASDGVTLRARWWPAPAETDEALLYLHGIQSHGGWFEWSASLLAAAGRPVLLPDRRGSGLSDGPRGDVAGPDRWLRDLDELASWLRDACGARHVSVVGVSWGGKLALAWARKRPQRVHRVLAIAPGVFPAVDVGTAARIQVGLAMLGQPARRFPIPLGDPALFTGNPDGQRFIAKDTLKLEEATARFLFHSARLDRELARARPGTLNCPVTLVLGAGDRIIRNEPTRKWLPRICGAAPQIHEIRGAAHTLEFESESGPFERILSEWAHAAAVGSTS